MAGSQTSLPRAGWMQLQPVPTRQSSVTEKQLHVSVPQVGTEAWFRLGFHSHTVIRVHPAKLPTLSECIRKPSPAPGQALPGTAAALPTQDRSCHGQPGVPSALPGELSPGVPRQWSQAPSCLPPAAGLGQPFPRGARRGQSPVPRFGSYHSAVLGLSPVARGRGVRTAAAPCSALTGRQGVEGGAGAGGQPRVRTVQQAFPALLLQALVHPLQLEVTYHVWGTARGPRREKILQHRPPRREGRGWEPRGPLLSPDRRYQPAGARCCAGSASISQTGVSRPPPLHWPWPCPPGRPRPQAFRGKGSGAGSPRPAPRGRGRVRAAAPGATPPAGSAGLGGGTGWGRDTDTPHSSTACAARRLPAAHLSGEGGREPGSALPFPRPPSSVPAARSRPLPRHGARSAPPARPLPHEGTGQTLHRPTGQGCPFAPPRGLWLPSGHSLTAVRIFPQLCSIFPYEIFVPLRSLHAPRLGKGPRHIQHAITGTASLHSFPHCCPKFSRTQS